MTLHEQIKADLRERYQQMINHGDLRSRALLQKYYSSFEERFGPAILSNLDGEELLNLMHALQSDNRDSLIYWLEFKNDEEFPAIFGSIAGGSSLKFGIYQRKEDGVWVTGSPQNQIEISTEEAILITRQHREQLLSGVRLLSELPVNGSDADYAELQQKMDELAPDVSNTAWGHKYLSLLFPEKLDDYHVESYQRFHLIKLLQLPPAENGRYAAAGRYVAIANELDIPINHLTSILNRRHGRPYRYWRFIANYPDTDGFQNNWELMRDGGFSAIGWHNLGDLSDIEQNLESKNRVRALMKEHYKDQGRWANEIFNFVARIEEGEIIIAFERSNILGIGRVTGPYVYDPSLPRIPHRRTVEWLNDETWFLPENEAKGRTVYQIRIPQNLVEVEKYILGAEPIPTVPSKPKIKTELILEGLQGRIQSILNRKKQVILYGPPGTGKTYWAKKTALDLAAFNLFGSLFADLTETQQQFFDSKTNAFSTVRMCTFHPAYGYEDFLEGYRPHSVENQLSFDRQDGIFKRLCLDASQRHDQKFYLIIDEINRGDIPRIFGELLTILEGDKRGQKVILPLSGEPFSVPENVFVIGTMNTADRSIALLDTALRRRFGFIELMPDITIFEKAVVGNSIPLGHWLKELNNRILQYIGRDARNLQIGHAYLLENGRPIADFKRFATVVQDDIIPLLEEYCYEDYSALSKILGDSLVDENQQRIRHELFSDDRRDDLVQALLDPAPDLATSAQVVAIIGEAELSEEEDDDLSELTE